MCPARLPFSPNSRCASTSPGPRTTTRVEHKFAKIKNPGPEGPGLGLLRNFREHVEPGARNVRLSAARTTSPPARGCRPMYDTGMCYGVFVRWLPSTATCRARAGGAIAYNRTLPAIATVPGWENVSRKRRRLDVLICDNTAERHESADGGLQDRHHQPSDPGLRLPRGARQQGRIPVHSRRGWPTGKTALHLTGPKEHAASVPGDKREAGAVVMPGRRRNAPARQAGVRGNLGIAAHR
jgi:hypothetical protein